MTLGKKIQEMIRARGYATSKAFLADVSSLFEENAITRRTLTRLIHNRGDVRLKTLIQIAHVLGTSVSSLREGTNAEITPGPPSPGLFTYNKKAVLQCLHRQLPFIPTRLTLKAGGKTSEEQDRPDAPEAVKWVYVLMGRATLVLRGDLGEERKEIPKGSSLALDAKVRHYFENTMRGTTILLILHYPATNNIFYTSAPHAAP